MTKRCVVCGSTPVDRCHIRSKGAGGPDEEWNLISQCRAHHREQHDLNWWRYVKKHPHIMAFLREKGWEWVEVLGIMKLWNPKLETQP